MTMILSKNAIGAVIRELPWKWTIPVVRSSTQARTIPIRPLSALTRTPYLKVKERLTSLGSHHHHHYNQNHQTATVRQILPIGATVRKGDVIALVGNGEEEDVTILASQPGRITQWYASPSQQIQLGEALLEIDNEFLLQDEQAWKEHLVLQQGNVTDEFLESYLKLDDVFRLNHLVQMIREEWKDGLQPPLNCCTQLYRRIVELQHDPAEQAQTRTEWGVLLHQLGDLQGALEQFLVALKLRQQVYRESHPHISASHFHLGAIYRQLNNPAKALEHMQIALNLQIQEMGDSNRHPRIAAGYNTVGAIHFQMGNYHEAKRNYETALQIHQQIQQGDNPDVAGTYHNMGVALKNLEDFKLAKQHLQTALDMRKRLQELSPEDPSTTADVAASHYAMGQLAAETGNLDVALNQFQAALSLQERIFGKESSVTAAAYANIGSIYFQQQNFHAALQTYRQGLEILQVIAPNHPDLAATYNNVGLAFYQLREYEDSLDHHTRARRILEGLYGRDHPILATTVGSIGNALQSLDQYDQAMKEFKKAHSLLEEALGSEHPEIASSFNNMGLMWSQQGEHEQALGSYRAAARVFAKTLGENHPHTASCHFNMGLVLKSQGHLAKAKLEFEHAQDIWQAVYGSEHPNIELAACRIQDCESASTYTVEN